MRVTTGLPIQLIALIFFAVMCFACPSPLFAQTTTPSLAKLTAEDEALLGHMPLKKKIGQMFMIGFTGHSMAGGLSQTIAGVAPGALVVFGRNISSARQISDLNIAAQQAANKSSGLPLLIAVDQEGGNVIRLKTAMPLPSALALGETGSAELAETAGVATGQLLATLGFNMNLAPVLDVASPEKFTFIGSRTYGRGADLVGKMGVGFSAGMLRSGVLPTGKHFPGHGGIGDDSHLGTPSKTAPTEELERVDLAPFRAMQASFKNRWAVMLAHVSYPSVDPSGMPATFSKPIVDGLLRKEMGFDGVILTDDIGMAGANSIKDVRERAVKAIEAGVDMIMVAWNRRLQAELVHHIETAVKSGRILESRIDESVRRIIIAKRAHATSLKRPTPNDLVLAVRNPKFAEIAQATVISKLQRLPEKSEREFKEFATGKPILVFSANPRFSMSFQEGMNHQRGRKTGYYGLSVETPINIDRVMRSNPMAVGVFYVSGYQAAKLLNTVSEDVARRMLVVTVEPPGILKKPETFRAIADIYYRHPNLGRMIAAHYFAEAGLLRGPAAERDQARLGLSNRAAR